MVQVYIELTLSYDFLHCKIIATKVLNGVNNYTIIQHDFVCYLVVPNFTHFYSI